MRAGCSCTLCLQVARRWGRGVNLGKTLQRFITPRESPLPPCLDEHSAKSSTPGCTFWGSGGLDLHCTQWETLHDVAEPRLWAITRPRLTMAFTPRDCSDNDHSSSMRRGRDTRGSAKMCAAVPSGSPTLPPRIPGSPEFVRAERMATNVRTSFSPHPYPLIPRASTPHPGTEVGEYRGGVGISGGDNLGQIS